VSELADWLPRAAAARPRHLAVRAPDGTLTYEELLGAARRADPAPVLDAAPSLPFVVDLHAALLHGTPVLPADPRWSAAERDERLAVTPAGALTLFTSGTTRAPRPVVLTPENLEASAEASARVLGAEPEDRWLLLLPLAHVGGLSILLRTAREQASVILHDGFDARSASAALRRDGISLVSLVPTMLARMLDAGLERPPHLRWALLGGAPAAPALLERAAAARVPVLETYGMTETASQVVTGGRPVPGARVELAPDGEIVVSGPMVAGGGPLRTGDLGAWKGDGTLRVVGRTADTIVSGGENVAPAEVEAALAAHPGVADVAVVGRPDPEWGEAVTALLVPRGAMPADDDLRAFCAARLARFKVPKTFEPVAELPRTASGKLRRTLLA
jgi:o-succinylbenzoate---CoA ligase